MGLTKEYRVEIRVRNNLLLKRIETEGYGSIGEFCRKNQLSPTHLGDIINMKRSPLMSNGDWRTIVLETSYLLNCSPEELFTETQMQLEMETNKNTLMVNEAEMKFMLDTQNQSKMLEDVVFNDQLDKTIDEVLHAMTPREEKILRMRYGLDDREYTLDEIGKEFGVSKNRIRIIEQRAMRRLRHPQRSSKLIAFLQQE